jgi:pimeloyl-ACP methyl ester carboxylesterase
MNALSRLAIATLVVTAVLPTGARGQVALPPFYAAASKLEAKGKLGQVLAKEPVSTRVPGAKAWRIAYVSSDVAGRKTLSTALVVAPAGPAPKEGRPVVAWAHGTTGTAQNCGPSQVLDPAQPLNQYVMVGGNSWTDYGLPALEEFIRAGYVVVGTDYQGLGAGGKHQYAIAATNGRDLINSVRAASSMKETGAGKRAVAYGWSQGGGATIAAASLGDYIAEKGTVADGITFVGFVALAPEDVAVAVPSNAREAGVAEKVAGELAATFSDSVFNFTHYLMTIWANAAAFSGLNVNEVLTDEGAAVAEEIFTRKCMHAAADTLAHAYGTGFKRLARPTVQNASAWLDAFIRGSVLPVKPVAPVIIYFGTKDVTVPPVMGKLYRDQMCKLGGNVARVQLAGEQDHYSTPPTAQPLYVPWVRDRFEGKPAADGCAAEAPARP